MRNGAVFWILAFGIAILYAILSQQIVIVNADDMGVPGLSVSGIIALMNPDPYGHKPYMITERKYDITFSYCRPDPNDPNSCAAIYYHTTHVRFKVYYQIYIHRTSNNEVDRVIVVYAVVRKYNDKWQGFLGMYGGREFTSLIEGYNYAFGGLFAPGVPFGWVIPQEGVYKDQGGSSEWAITAGLSYKIVIFSVTFSPQAHGPSYYIDERYQGGHGDEQTIGLEQVVVRTGDIDEYYISFSHNHVLPGGDHESLILGVAYQAVDENGNSLLPAWLAANILKIHHNYYEWSLWGLEKTWWDPHPLKRYVYFPEVWYYYTGQSS